MKIYVGIANIGDFQIPFTVRDIFQKADNPQNIFVGVAHMIENIDAFNHCVEELKEFPNATHKMFNIFENFGVGKGRANALSFYNNEDYVLQIDSHTKFEKGWDTFLINAFEEAKKETKSEKLILTGYLAPYAHKNGKDRENIGPSKPKYSFIIDEKRKKFDHMFLYEHSSILEIEYDSRFLQKGLNKSKFIPAIKLSAAFIFSDKEFIKNTGLPKNCYFWSEEVIQSINLFHYGFSLVFTNLNLPLRHLFVENIELGVSNRVVQNFEYHGHTPKDDDAVYYNWMTDPENEERIKKYTKYSNFHPLNGSIKKFIIPESYR